MDYVPVSWISGQVAADCEAPAHAHEQKEVVE